MQIQSRRQGPCRIPLAQFAGHWFALAAVLALAVFAFLPTGAQAQPAKKYWIYFADKPTEKPLEVSERAVQRRRARGIARSNWFDRPVSTSYVENLRALGIEPVVQSRWLNAVSAYLPEALTARVTQLEFVQRVELISRSERHALSPGVFTPSGAESGLQPLVYNLNYGPSEKQLVNINAIDPLESGINGTGIRLGFLDTPYNDFQHTVFDHLTSSGRLIQVRDFTGRDQGSTHGLSVASVAVGFEEGHLIGPAHGAEVLAAVTEYAPTETNQEEDFFVAGMEWLEANGADVVNVSLGYTTFDSLQQSYAISDLDGDTGVTTQAADLAASLGVVVVVSAGNSGCASPDHCWYYIGTPADGDSVIAVGGIRPDSVRAFFSSYGPTADDRTKPDISAPGASVYVAVPTGFGYTSGTSFASPLVAGVVCQILQVNPDLSPIEVRQVLRETASQADAPDNSLGWGIINASAAIQRAEALSSEEPARRARLSVEAYPNPATDYVFIHINATRRGRATLTLYDLLGRAVYSNELLVEPDQSAIRLSTRDLPSGLYVYSAAVDGERASGNLIVR